MFDSFKYKYLKVGDKAVSNRLYHVNDSINASIMTDDIDDEGTYSDASETINSWNNYGYDEIGNLQRDSTEGIKHIEWTAYGKIKSIVRRDGYFKTINGVNVYPSNLEFMYDAMGNRIAKIEKPRDANGQKSSADWKTTYYIRDAQGNPMATYKKSSETEAASFKLIEHPIYGSSRVGIDNYTVEFVGYTAPSSGLTSRVLGLKQYELTNHLGNVLTTISDKRIPVENNGVVDHYVADITTASDYYPFGSPMDGRTFSSEKYRFGFNTQEKVDEVYGKGNLNTALFWGYDTRLGRRWNLDPKPNPNISDYACFANNPILFNDELGDTLRVCTNNGQGYVEEILEEAFGDKYKRFSFDSEQNLNFNGDLTDFSKKELIVLKGLLKVMGEKEVTEIIFMKSTNITDHGGEATSTLFENRSKGHKSNKIYIDPDNPYVDVFKIPISVQIYKMKGIPNQTTEDPWKAEEDDNGALKVVKTVQRMKSITVNRTRYSRFFHGVGHVLYQAPTVQRNVITYESSANKIKKSKTKHGKYKKNPEEKAVDIDGSHQNRSSF